ncbi:MAG: hypothetical protein U0359_36480 [Byssovorax sp.]
MATKADFTAEEWELLCSGPALAGIGVTLLESGAIADLRELHATAKATAAGKGEYAESELVQGVLAEAATHDSAHVRHQGMTTDEVLGKLQQIDQILDKKGGEIEGIRYKNFLFHVADAAAHASGGFLGLGNKVSDDERTYLAKLKDILFRDAAA